MGSPKPLIGNQVKHSLIILISFLLLIFNPLISNLTFAQEEETDDSDTMESVGDLNEKDSSDQKRGDSDLNVNQKLRFRSLSGTYTSDTQEYSSSTSSIIWKRLGIGQSVFKYKTNNSGNLYDLENKLIDISYTFGDDFTLTTGVRSVTSGKLTITTSDSGIFNSSDVDGSGYFSTLGIEIGIFEILAGFQYGSYAFTEIENKSTSSYVPKYQGSTMIYVTGIGLAF